MAVPGVQTTRRRVARRTSNLTPQDDRMRFHTTLQAPDGTNTGIEVPEHIVLSFDAGKRPPVVVTVNGFTYRSTIAPMGGSYWIPVSKDRRETAGIAANDDIDVTLELDTAPRIVEVPADLAEALDAVPGAREAFDRLSVSRKRAHVESVTGAKQAETRIRRIAKVVSSVTS